MSDPYCFETACDVSASSLKFRPSLTQNFLCDSALSTLTPRITAFLRAVRGESPLAVTVLDGVRATAVALRAIEAAATATRLAVDWRGCL